MPVINPVTGLELIQYQGGMQPHMLDNVRALFEDYTVGTPNNQQWAVVSTGTGSTTTKVTTGEQDHPGVLEVRAGTTATAGSMQRGVYTSPQIRMSDGPWRMVEMARLAQLSDGTNTFNCMLCGLSNITGVTSTTVVDGIWFEYTHTLNGGEWTAICRTNNVQTALSAGIVADTNWHEFTIEGAANSGQVDFFIDDVRVVSIAENVPPASVTLNYLTGRMLKSAGAITRSLFIDYFFHGFSYLEPR